MIPCNSQIDDRLSLFSDEYFLLKIRLKIGMAVDCSILVG